MKVSIVQTKLYMGKVDKNYQLIEEGMNNALKENPDVILLPELWNTSFFPKNVKEIADPGGERAKEFLSSFAKQHDVNIVGGSVANLLDGELYNTSYVYNRKGELVASYNKVHLFSPSGEDNTFQCGSQLATFELDGVKCGLVICYDIRFTEWIRMNALEGISILFNPAAWPEIRNNHWDTLNRARAIENQMFVVCSNSLGDSDDEGNRFGGHSAVIDPWGEYIVEPDSEPGIKTGEIDLSVIKGIRESINVFRDRQPDLYEVKQK